MRYQGEVANNIDLRRHLLALVIAYKTSFNSFFSLSVFSMA